MKVDETPDSVLNLLRENFNRAYDTTRAPFTLTLDADFLLSLPSNGSLIALENFLVEVRLPSARTPLDPSENGWQILEKPDVYVVGASEVIAWMREPRPLSGLGDLWDCPASLRSAFRPCQVPLPPPPRVSSLRAALEFANRCGYDTELGGGEHWFRTCKTCPRAYPWLHNPAGSPLRAPFSPRPSPIRGRLDKAPICRPRKKGLLEPRISLQ